MTYAFEDSIIDIKESMIDWTKFYLIEEGGFMDWAEKNKYKKGKWHFLEEANKDFAETKLGPWVKNEISL